MAKSERKQNTLNSLPEKIITTPEDLTECCEHLMECRRFGLDTEFVGEDSYHPRLCLIQIATESSLFLIDPESVGSLDVFWRAVTDPGNLVIVHAGREEIRLCQLWCGKPPGNLFDLQIAAGLIGLVYPLSHAKLVKQLLHVHLDKAETLTEWRNRPLSAEQIDYAFDDVRYLLPLWEKISTNLDFLGRLSWAREETERLKVQAALNDQNILPTGEKWRKLRGIGSLDRRKLAVVRELYVWRETAAAHMNRPSRTVVRDDLLVEIARRNPRNAGDLNVMRGLPKRTLEPILQAVNRARALPVADCPTANDRDKDPAQLGIAGYFLTAFLNDLCIKQQLASNLVATQQDLKLLIRGTYYGKSLLDDSLLSAGWRAAHVLPELEAALNGERCVCMGDLQRADPLSVRAEKTC